MDLLGTVTINFETGFSAADAYHAWGSYVGGADAAVIRVNYTSATQVRFDGAASRTFRWTAMGIRKAGV
jgi:hypothetical protein